MALVIFLPFIYFFFLKFKLPSVLSIEQNPQLNKVFGDGSISFGTSIESYICVLYNIPLQSVLRGKHCKRRNIPGHT